MSKNNLYEKFKKLLNYIEEEINKELCNHSYETRIWSKGYRKAMITIKNFIWNILNRDN